MCRNDASAIIPPPSPYLEATAQSRSKKLPATALFVRLEVAALVLGAWLLSELKSAPPLRARDEVLVEDIKPSAVDGPERVDVGRFGLEDT